MTRDGSVNAAIQWVETELGIYKTSWRIHTLGTRMTIYATKGRKEEVGTFDVPLDRELVRDAFIAFKVAKRLTA